MTDHVSPTYVITVVVGSYLLAFFSGWAAGILFKMAGYTHTISATIVGGGESTVIHPVSGEWYGGQVAVVVLLLAFVYGLWWRPKQMGERE
jgi:hypothetical protein